jgi:glc operon protein GlcG
MMRRTLISATLLMTTGLVAHGQEAKPTMGLETAGTIVKACLDHAEAQAESVAIAVYDQHGNLHAFARMDDASAGVSDIAMWKGKSAGKYGYATAMSADWGPGPGDVANWRGGLPIHLEGGELIGGVGVSGAPSVFDEECGNVGIAAAGLPMAEIMDVDVED